MRLILSGQVDPAERSDILTAFGLELSDIRDEPGQAYAEVWMPLDLDDEAVIHYVDDIPIGVRYFVVNDGADWEERIRAALPTMREEDVLDRARGARTDAERIAATFLLALIAPPVRQEPFFSELKASLLHDSTDVRHAAILAAGYTTWPDLAEILQRLRDDDASPRVRERARLMLESVASHGWVET